MRLANCHSLQLEYSLPLKIGAISYINHRQITSPSIVVSAIFSKLCLISMLARKSSICTKCHVLHYMSGFVNIFAFDIPVTSTELKLKAHHGSARHIYKQPTRTVVEPHLYNCMFHLATLFSILALRFFLFTSNVAFTVGLSCLRRSFNRAIKVVVAVLFAASDFIDSVFDRRFSELC